MNSFLTEQQLVAVPRIIAFMVFGVFLIALPSCDKGAVLEPRIRPSSVPSSAKWAGGPDGGSYVECSIDKEHNANKCTVWNDYTGQIVESGYYRLSNQNRAATKDELRIKGADRGGTILLEGDLVLRLQDNTTR